VDASSGAVRWKVKTDDEVHSSPTVAKGVVYFGSQDTYLYALNASTGARIWRTQVGVADANGFVNGALVDSQPAVGTDTVYVTAGESHIDLWAFDVATGKLRWRYETVDDLSSSPVVANGVAYFCGTSASHALFAVTA
jgi:outer membrane protein assembly factor BamB